MLEAWIGNLGKYNEGELVGEWVDFPTDRKTIEEVFEEIGLDEEYEGFFIWEYDSPDTPSLEESSILGEHPSLEELNYLALTLEELPQDDLDKFNACIDSGIAGVSSIADAINLAENMDCYELSTDVADKHELGYHYVHEAGIFDTQAMEPLTDFIDYEAFGIYLFNQQIGEFSYLGYVEEVDCMTEYYHDQNDIPAQDRLFSLVGENQKEEKPSILESLKEGKEAVKKAEQKEEKSECSPSKNKGCR